MLGRCNGLFQAPDKAPGSPDDGFVGRSILFTLEVSHAPRTAPTIDRKRRDPLERARLANREYVNAPFAATSGEVSDTMLHDFAFLI